ncbi:LysR family transcriptional regulator [Clostridium estertheticum]|uniref:LysR family transcriptional regulator n=1 Tax=Clostridium estertheticum TaxID=238834 RepID=A0A7Y3WTW0_9CLOT|nr:LysR family transcriptional regulator [Clostridium estertheticum]NNU77521.1 LysR family transcriptional regulator [Clostridium estertheticum]WBL48536.1 LysR family transcriptional regulator [Clostridium estertheticum]
MDIRLQTFITVTKIKSFTKASEILNITQPAVSQHIKFLEEYYGVIFIKKCGKSIKLTEEGKILYKYAIELNSIYRNLEAEFRNKDNINKTYYIGASMTIGGYILPYILADYRNCYKNIDILLQVNNTEEILKKLLNRTIDLALIEGNFDREKFKYIKYKDDELVLAVSHLHEFAKYKNITLDKVLKGKLILREKGSGTREIFENDLLEMGYDLKDFKPYMELGSITAIKSLVEANLGYSIISKETVKKEVESGIIKIIPIKGLRIFREFNFVYIKDSDEEFVKTFIGFCLK